MLFKERSSGFQIYIIAFMITACAAILMLVLPVGREVYSYYICLSQLGDEDYPDAVATFNHINLSNPTGYKAKDISKRIHDLSEHHFDNAKYYYKIGDFKTAGNEITKAWQLNPNDKPIMQMYIRLNLQHISALDLKACKDALFSGSYFSQAVVQPFWDFALGLVNGELARYSFEGHKTEVLGTEVQKFISSKDGRKYAYMTSNMEGNIRAPQIWVGDRFEKNKPLKFISFRDHLLKRYSDFQLDTGSIALETFSPDNENLLFQTLNGGIPTLWVYDLSSETMQTFEKAVETAFRPNSEDFCYVKLADVGPGNSLFLYSQKYGRNKIFNETDNGTVVNPRWSPDGKHIAFYFRQGDIQANNLFVITPNGREKFNLGPCENNSRYMWSPDGKELFYLQNGNIKVWLFNNKNYTLMSLPEEITYFSLSPGGKKLAFLTQTGLWLSDSKGYNKCERKSTGSYNSLEWTDYGGRLALRQGNDIIIYVFEKK